MATIFKTFSEMYPKQCRSESSSSSPISSFVSLRTFMRRFSDGHFELPPIGLQHPLLGAFSTLNQQIFISLICDKDQGTNLEGMRDGWLHNG